MSAMDDVRNRWQCYVEERARLDDPPTFYVVDRKHDVIWFEDLDRERAETVVELFRLRERVRNELKRLLNLNKLEHNDLQNEIDYITRLLEGK